MSKGRILVTGASGFLGWNLLQEPWPDWEWIACAHRHDPAQPGVRLVQTDLTAPGAIVSLLDATQPTLVLHAAALTDLNACETDPAATQQINVAVPAELARQCTERAIRFVFTSSDMVFDGDHPPYSEQSAPCPINAYGRQKAEAEADVQALCPEATICRMPLMFGEAGPHAHNFLPEWLGQMSAGQPVSLFTDEFRAPVSAAIAREGLRMAIDHKVHGIFHLGGRERMSRYAFGKLLCSLWGFDSALLHPTQRAALNFKAPRPADTWLDSQRAWRWGYAAASLEEQLRTVKAEGHIAQPHTGKA